MWAKNTWKGFFQLIRGWADLLSTSHPKLSHLEGNTVYVPHHFSCKKSQEKNKQHFVVHTSTPKPSCHTYKYTKLSKNKNNI